MKIPQLIWQLIMTNIYMGKRFYFIDTSFLVAFLYKKDQDHQKATDIFKQTIVTDSRIVQITTDYVLDETLTTLKVRAGCQVAAEFSKMILQSDLSIAYITPQIFRQALDYFAKHQDKDYSFTDCVSFIVIENYKIQNVFTFDRHFEQAGFNIVR